MRSLVGIAALLSGVAMASTADDSAYYLAETNEERSMDVIEKSRYERSDLGASEGPGGIDDEEEQPLGDDGPSDDAGLRNGDAKRSIVKMNLRDRSSTHLQAPTPSSTLLYWPQRKDELVAMEQRRNPAIQARRNPSFSPWGGKRDMQRYKTITKTRRPVRVPFNSWGGKRNGQRIQPAITDPREDNFVNGSGKKAPSFDSRGGKRYSGIDSGLVPLDRRQERRREHRQGLRRWKQLDIGETGNDFDSNSAEESYSEKVTSNETWGKRGPPKALADGEMTTSGSTRGNSFPRMPFEPWGENGRGETRFHDDGQPTAGVSLMIRKIERFVPWTG